MPRLALSLATLAWSGLLAGMVPAGAGGPDPLAAHRWRHRVLLAAAPTARDPTLALQRAAFAAMRAGARERDLVLVEVVGETAQARAVRQRFGLDPSGFAAILVGKDGGEKLRSARALDAQQLFPVIDAMPMRQSEMKRR